MSIVSCSVDGCDRPKSARGWCIKHYQRWYSTGSVADPIEHAVCGHCGGPTERKGDSGPHPRYCSGNCSSKASYFRRRDEIGNRRRAETAARPKPVITCKHCGDSTEARKSTTMFCSSRCATKFRRGNHDGTCSGESCHRTAEARGMCIVCWRRWARATGREANPAWDDNRRAHYHKRRAQKRGTQVEDLRPVDIYERDIWICGLCVTPVDPTSAWPDPMSPSLDHILPLSRGGTHTYENVQLAHLTCNVSKGNRIAA
ncbi:endogenous inhibitor of DNA gyrase (YacG/DUF329 family) [Arthrobacter sp. ES3-54]|nr:endogenous inhibitor of DNA gyrase (YacG/DUF329 family) [Arthrobacter sp. ES3-54]